MAESSQRRGLRLFLSADLAGSTAFKQASKPEEWQQFFRGFYEQLPTYVADYIRSSGAKDLPLWKTLGDEIVFSTELSASADVLPCVAAFRSAVAAYRREIRESPGLDLKCAGWTAGFPVGNLRVPLAGGGEDYIGPGMDIGFRLVKEAPPRRMHLSVELAYLLTIPELPGCPDLFFDHGLDLKGVGRGRRYPCIWLDNFAVAAPDKSPKELALVEEQLRHDARQPCDRELLHDYCRRWLLEMREPFVIPFIDEDAFIGQRPDGYDEALAKVLAGPQSPEEMQVPAPKTDGAKKPREEIIEAIRDAVKQEGSQG